MRISELLTHKKKFEIICANPDQSLFEVASILMKHRIGGLPVVDDQQSPIGIVTERDIVNNLAALGTDVVTCRVGDAMTKALITCEADDDVVATLAIMNKHKFRHMPVMKEGKLISMLSIREFDTACRHLQSLSRTDELTGLSNRRHFVELLSAEFKRHDRHETPLCVAMLDVDKFKLINDKYGHDVGDEVLRMLAAVMTNRLRSYDVVGRLGGEEFGILFPDTMLADAIAVCETLLERIRTISVDAGSETIRFTASFGVTDLRNEPGDIDQVMSRADKLLYLAKNRGRDRVVSDLIEGASPTFQHELAS